jgi:hypothetical protein
VYLSVCLSVGVSARCDWSSLPPEAIRHHLYLPRLPPEAMPLYPANLPPEAVRYFSTLQIYRRRPDVNILCQAMREHLYPTNLPPDAKGIWQRLHNHIS